MHGEDAFDSRKVDSTERGGSAEREVDVGRGIAFTQQENLPGLLCPGARHTDAHQLEELGRALSHVAEGDVDLIQVDRGLSLRRRMKSGRVERQSRASWRELMTRDAAQVCSIDKELALRDAHGQEIGDMVVGHGVATMWRAT